MAEAGCTYIWRASCVPDQWVLPFEYLGFTLRFDACFMDEDKSDRPWDIFKQPRYIDFCQRPACLSATFCNDGRGVGKVWFGWESETGSLSCHSWNRSKVVNQILLASSAVEPTLGGKPASPYNGFGEMFKMLNDVTPEGIYTVFSEYFGVETRLTRGRQPEAKWDTVNMELFFKEAIIEVSWVTGFDANTLQFSTALVVSEIKSKRSNVQTYNQLRPKFHEVFAQSGIVPVSLMARGTGA